VRIKKKNKAAALSFDDLVELNKHRYRYIISQKDFKLVSGLIARIENRDWEKVAAGDVINLSALKSDRTYERGHIEKIDCGSCGHGWESGTAYCCTEPYVPFVHKTNGGVYFNTSGGYWVLLDRSKFLRIDIQRKLFTTFEGRLPGADGAVYFWANVVRWQYAGKEIY